MPSPVLIKILSDRDPTKTVGRFYLRSDPAAPSCWILSRWFPMNDKVEPEPMRGSDPQEAVLQVVASLLWLCTTRYKEFVEIRAELDNPKAVVRHGFRPGYGRQLRAQLGNLETRFKKSWEAGIVSELGRLTEAGWPAVPVPNLPWLY